jgi:hypothetical protein
MLYLPWVSLTTQRKEDRPRQAAVAVAVAGAGAGVSQKKTWPMCSSLNGATNFRAKKLVILVFPVFFCCDDNSSEQLFHSEILKFFYRLGPVLQNVS